MNQARSQERSALLSEVLHGRMSPAEADAKALANGLDLFEQTADLAKCNPMATRDWSLAMAVSWIVWRDLMPVRQAWDKFRLQRVFWAPIYRRDGTDATWDIVGHYLERLPVATIQSVWLAAKYPSKEPWLVEDAKACPGPGLMEVYDASAQLWEKLGGATLQGYGIKAGEKTRSEVQEFHWSMLETHALPPGVRADADALYAKGQALSAPLYRNVVLERSKLVQIWPAQTSAMTPQADPAQKKRPPKWLAIDKAIAAKWPEGRPQFTSNRQRNKNVLDAVHVMTGNKSETISKDTFHRYFAAEE